MNPSQTTIFAKSSQPPNISTSISKYRLSCFLLNLSPYDIHTVILTNHSLLQQKYLETPDIQCITISSVRFLPSLLTRSSSNR